MRRVLRCPHPANKGRSVKMDGRRAYRICEQMRSKKSAWQSLFDEAVRYGRTQAAEGDGRGIDSDTGEERREPINTYVATRAERLATGIFSNAINSGRQFFRFAAKNHKKYTPQRAKDWLSLAEEEVVNALKGSNFLKSAALAVDDLVILGTAPCGIFWEDGGPVFRNFSVQKGVALGTNNLGDVDTICIYMNFTAKQAIQEFGEDKVSENVRNAREDQNRIFEYVQLVYPKAAFGETVDKSRGDHRSMPYGSVYVEVETKRIMRKQGFSGFPFAVSRWKKEQGETYGRSPVMRCVADAKSLNRVEHDIADIATFSANPPMAVPAACKDFKMISGYANKLPVNDLRGAIWAYQPQTNIPMLENYIERRKQNVDDTCLAKVFSPLGDEMKSNVTMYETSARMHLHAQDINPYIVNFQNDFLEVVVRRVLVLLIENGVLEEPPPEIYDVQIQVKYISPLDSMLNQGETAKIQQAFLQLSQVFQAIGSVPDAYLDEYVDTVRMGLFFLRANGVPENMLRSEDEVKEAIVARREEAKQLQNKMLQTQMLKPIDVSKAPQEGSPMAEGGLG